ncbi:hypothetical protein CVT24_005783 [Panaeolus cyanescens]|uniref:Uncharacterized protein n=1 Tax=Panaeolus cyanescens TaxID=181874 RepID=A0A409V929_9AGAR|nr:hypothetical protein CVT24_005783 [Panaeolus cyanescens]
MSSVSQLDKPRRAPYDDDCPDYEAVISRSNSNGTSTYSSRFSDNHSRSVTTPLKCVAKVTAAAKPVVMLERSDTSVSRRPRPLPRHERYVYTYKLLANGTPLQFLISVEPESGKPTHGKCTFRLSFKANGIESIFPGKQSLPAGCLWSLRVWLRVNGVDHRIFGDDDLWVAKDPDFNSIGDASYARLKTVDSTEQVYHGYVGRALVTFVVRWQQISNKLYRYSVDYEANGVGDTLVDDFRVRLDGDPRGVTFLIYTVPTNAIPAGASHKLRVWMRSLVPITNDPGTSYVLPFNDSFIYQRIWKNDNFRLGSRLDFDSLGTKMVKGFSVGAPETIVMPDPPSHAEGHRTSSSVDLHSPRSVYAEKRTGLDHL